MTPQTMSLLARETSGRLYGEDAVFSSICNDTRRLRAGELYVAIRGANFDGNAFVEAAMDKGAAGALVDRHADCALPQVEVPDTRVAMGAFARFWRSQFDIPVIAITGSNGKTTIKEMTASILRRRGQVLATRGNLNNDIGVPLTLFEISQQDTAAVIEMGANHAGEIEYLAHIAEPDVAVVSNAGPAHLEGFGSVAGVAKAKGEVFAALGPAGVAVINADDEFAPLWRSIAGRRQCVTFGIDHEADFSALSVKQEKSAGSIATRFRMQSKAGDVGIRIPFAGRHNVRNALAAAAAAWSAGADLEDIVEGLSAAPAVQGRLQLLTGSRGETIIDDTYNANPASLAAALEVQRSLPGEPWLVLGDMGELGEESHLRHAEMGAFSRDKGVARLFATGPLARHAVEAFGPGGRWFPDRDRMIEAIRDEIGPDISVLIKASRAMAFEQVTRALAESQEPPSRQVNGG